MSFNAQTLNQAREALFVAARQKQELLDIIRGQGTKIGELEAEVQAQASDLARTRQALGDAQQEIEAIRAQLPDAATVAAYESLVSYLTTAADETTTAMRIAA